MGYDPSKFSQSLQQRIRKQINQDDQARLSRRSSKLQKQQENCEDGEEIRADNKAGVQGDNAGHDKAIRHAVTMHFYFSDKRRRDLDGCSATVLDTLVDAKVLVDDNRFCVSKIIAESFDCDKGQDRVEIIIQEIV